jgi:hypothetical protein
MPTVEIEARFDIGEECGRVGVRRGAESGSEGGFDLDGLVEPGSEGEGRGEGVEEDGVGGGETESLPGDGERDIGVGRRTRSGGEEPSDIVEEGRVGRGFGSDAEEGRKGLAPEAEIPDGGGGEKTVFGGTRRDVGERIVQPNRHLVDGVPHGGIIR